MKRLWVILLAAMVVLAGFGYAARDSLPSLWADSEAQVEVENATTLATTASDLPAILAETTVVVEAIVMPQRQAQLSVAGSGVVEMLFVSEGDYLAAGMPLLQLRGDRQRAALAQAEANLRNAQAQLGDLQAAARPQEVVRRRAAVTTAAAALQRVFDGANNDEVVAARSNLGSADAALRRARADYDTVSWRSDIGRLSQSSALEQATNDYLAAEARLNELLAGPKQTDVAQAQADLEAAQADLDLLLAGATTEAILAAEANVASAAAVVLDAQVALDEMTVRAPFAGVLAALDVEIGEYVSPGASIGHLADISTWHIETSDLTEIDVVDVAPGDRVRITLDALPDLVLNGTVLRIRPIGENSQGDITYTAVIEMDEQDDRLRWNMTAETAIVADEAGRTAAVRKEELRRAMLARLQTPAAVEAMDPAVAAGPQAITPAAASQALVPSAPDVVATVVTNGVALNVRSAPGIANPVVGTADSGAQLTVIAADGTGGWLQVELADGTVGWVSANFVTEIASVQ